MGRPARTLKVLWINDEAATAAFALAFGMQISLLAQCQVNNATFAGRHRREFVRHVGFADSVCGYAGGHAKFFEAQGTLIHAIEIDLFMLVAR